MFYFKVKSYYVIVIGVVNVLFLFRGKMSVIFDYVNF